MRAEVRIPRAFEVPDAVLILRVDSPGFQKRVKRIAVRTLAALDGPTRVFAVPGATARGRVIDRQGKAAHPCRIAGLAPTPDAHTAEDGTFELHFERSGRSELYARAPGVGTYLGTV